jgi:hypothetical protein
VWRLVSNSLPTKNNLAWCNNILFPDSLVIIMFWRLWEEENASLVIFYCDFLNVVLESEIPKYKEITSRVLMMLE